MSCRGEEASKQTVLALIKQNVSQGTVETEAFSRFQRDKYVLVFHPLLCKVAGWCDFQISWWCCHAQVDSMLLNSSPGISN